MGKFEIINTKTGEHVLYNENTGGPRFFRTEEKALDALEQCQDEGVENLIVAEIE